jgi:hypothetical protein
MDNSFQLITRLRNTIGAEVEYNGVRCTVIELLDNPLSLVLQAVDSRDAIQDNQFGTPQRRVKEIFTLPCLNGRAGNSLHEDILALDLRLE